MFYNSLNVFFTYCQENNSILLFIYKFLVCIAEVINP